MNPEVKGLVWDLATIAFIGVCIIGSMVVLLAIALR
jgi:hypothetical protein